MACPAILFLTGLINQRKGGRDRKNRSNQDLQAGNEKPYHG